MHRHRYSFFGQKTGILFDSAEWTEPFIFLRFLKKKPSGEWERPSEREGKTIKFNLLEIVSVLDVCLTPGKKWTTVHRFGVEQTPITFDNQGEQFAISIPSYQKYLKFPETKLFTDMLGHVYQEKLEHSTSWDPDREKQGLSADTSPTPQKSVSAAKYPVRSNPYRDQLGATTSEAELSEEYDFLENEGIIADHTKVNLPLSRPKSDMNGTSDTLTSVSTPSPKASPAWLLTLVQNENFFLVPGQIEARSKKAIAYKIEGLQPAWIPLSCLKDEVPDPNQGGLWIKKWFMEKKVEELTASS